MFKLEKKVFEGEHKTISFNVDTFNVHNNI